MFNDNNDTKKPRTVMRSPKEIHETLQKFFHDSFILQQFPIVSAHDIMATT